MVDALASGASRGNPVEVQVLSSAPYKGFKNLQKDRKPWAYKALRFFYVRRSSSKYRGIHLRQRLHAVF